MKIFLSFFLLTTLHLAAQTPPEKLSLDNGWRFYEGDITGPAINGHGMSYANAKAGRAWGAAAPDFDDTGWPVVNLPHDWAVEQPFDSTANVSQGYRKRGIGWCRRNFKLDAADRGKHLEIQIGGVATHCTVWVNGTIVHRNWSGYTSFYIDITALAKYGNDLNNISVRVDAVAQEGWWYEGAGMYRHTWLVKRSPVHIITDGVFAHPIKNTANTWTIPAEITVENSGKQAADYQIEMTLLDKTGKTIISQTTTANVKSLSQTVSKLALPVTAPQLWSIETPTLYSVRTVVKQGNILYDSITTTCGFRTIRFDADSGLYLNDKRIKIKGVCNHQDHAGVGVAVPNSLWDFRLKRLREMGVNGYRCAHNPPAAEFLDACDRIGILVMDENRNFNSSPEYIRQVEWMVRRDRNHPSIMLWSVFNEEPMQGTENGYEMVRRMNAVVKEFDTTRPVTAAANGGLFSPQNVTQAVDVVGFNYQIGSYDPFRKAHPEMKLTSSEDASGLMTRGEYKNDKKRNVLEAYDTQFPSWGATHRVAWKAVAERPFLAGCFVWTGFDYRGEPQPFEWPSVSSSFGIMDLCGFPKTAFYLHQAQWVENKNILQLVPHWNWPKDSIGKPIRVMALSNAERVKLYLNGKLLQDTLVDKYEMNTWKVPYQPGKLEAVGLRNGKIVSHFTVETTGEPVSLQLIPDRQAIAGEGQDAVPITVRVVDAKGRPVENANLPVEFELTGPGSIIGHGNGDATSHEPEKGNRRSLYNGLAQIILQSKAASTGPLILTAKSPSLKNATTTITVTEAPQIPTVPIANPSLVLDRWRISPITTTHPDPNQEIADFDQNSWAPTRTGQLQNIANGSFAIFRTTFRPFTGQQKNGGKLLLKNVAGKAEVWLDNKLLFTKTDAAAADMMVTIPAGNGSRKLSILVEGNNGGKAGLGGLVSVE